ncbi:MAG: DUF2442 domain-containing protein [Marinilabiliaceae bacterium]|nr:DUF2442 domain-containing protein [Marinilabiliaceae bacterium]
MFLEVAKAEYLDNYRISLTFNNGETKTVDLQNELNGIVYEPLHEIDYFKNFQVKYNTIEWSNGADYAPEYLYEIGNPL